MTKRKPFTEEQMKCHAKLPFASERVAQRRADERAAVVGHPLRAYRCPHCKQWHMTKSIPGQPKQAREWKGVTC